jgi:hypothetical protein
MRGGNPFSQVLQEALKEFSPAHAGVLPESLYLYGHPRCSDVFNSTGRHTRRTHLGILIESKNSDR